MLLAHERLNKSQAKRFASAQKSFDIRGFNLKNPFEIQHKPIEMDKIVSYLNDYAPLVKEISNDEKFHDDCLDLLDLKDKCLKDHNYIQNHEMNLVFDLSIYKKAHAIAAPFVEKLTERMVSDIKQSTQTQNWEEVMRDLGVLTDLNKLQVRKNPLYETKKERIAIAQMGKEEIAQINEKLRAEQWLPNVTIEGIAFQKNKNIGFTVKGEPVFIYPDGMRVTADNEPVESFVDYLKKRGIQPKEGFLPIKQIVPPISNELDGMREAKKPADRQE